MRGIFCIDPGQSTGVAWGVLNEKWKGYAWEAVRDRINSASTTVTGDEQTQIRQLYQTWSAFKRACVRQGQMEPDWIDLVVEDFVLFPGEKPGRNTTWPERVAWGFEGYRMAMFDRHRPHAQPALRHITPITWQKSAAASRFFKDRDLMTNAGCWIRGRDHERSAFAHMILRTNVLMDHNAR